MGLLTSGHVSREGPKAPCAAGHRPRPRNPWGSQYLSPLKCLSLYFPVNKMGKQSWPRGEVRSKTF